MRSSPARDERPISPRHALCRISGRITETAGLAPSSATPVSRSLLVSAQRSTDSGSIQIGGVDRCRRLLPPGLSEPAVAIGKAIVLPPATGYRIRHHLSRSLRPLFAGLLPGHVRGVPVGPVRVALSGALFLLALSGFRTPKRARKIFRREANAVSASLMRAGSRVVIFCNSPPLPSGSLNVA